MHFYLKKNKKKLHNQVTNCISRNLNRSPFKRKKRKKGTSIILPCYMNENESCGPLPLPVLSQDLIPGKCEHECKSLCARQRYPAHYESIWSIFQFSFLTLKNSSTFFTDLYTRQNNKATEKENYEAAKCKYINTHIYNESINKQQNQK